MGQRATLPASFATAWSCWLSLARGSSISDHRRSTLREPNLTCHNTSTAFFAHRSRDTYPVIAVCAAQHIARALLRRAAALLRGLFRHGRSDGRAAATRPVPWPVRRRRHSQPTTAAGAAAATASERCEQPHQQPLLAVSAAASSRSSRRRRSSSSSSSSSMCRSQQPQQQPPSRQ